MVVLWVVVWDAGCGSPQRPGRGLSRFISLFDAQGNVLLQGAFTGVTGVGPVEAGLVRREGLETPWRLAAVLGAGTALSGSLMASRRWSWRCVIHMNRHMDLREMPHDAGEPNSSPSLPFC